MDIEKHIEEKKLPAMVYDRIFGEPKSMDDDPEFNLESYQMILEKMAESLPKKKPNLVDIEEAIFNGVWSVDRTEKQLMKLKKPAELFDFIRSKIEWFFNRLFDIIAFHPPDDLIGV